MMQGEATREGLAGCEAGRQYQAPLWASAPWHLWEGLSHHGPGCQTSVTGSVIQSGLGLLDSRIQKQLGIALLDVL